MVSRRFEAVGTTCELLVDAEESVAVRLALLEAEGEVLRLEALLSRFRFGSELSRLNREGSLQAGAELLEVVGLALAARERTAGSFDPTVLPALIAAGYDRSFEALTDCGGAATTEHHPCAGGVRIDADAGTIELDPGVQLDLGGIAKGWIADRLSRRLDSHGPSLANIGGDLSASRPPASGTWPVGVEVPAGRIALGLESGGLATSGRDRRSWLRGGEHVHHAIDPVTARPSATDLLRVTVAADSGVEAEISATVLLLAGERAACEEAGRLGVACLLVTRDARAVMAGGLA